LMEKDIFGGVLWRAASIPIWWVIRESGGDDGMRGRRDGSCFGEIDGDLERICIREKTGDAMVSGDRERSCNGEIGGDLRLGFDEKSGDPKKSGDQDERRELCSCF
jgi:hypothetical protein